MGQLISNDEAEVRFHSLLETLTEAEATNDPLPKQALMRMAKARLDALLPDRFAEVYAMDNAAAAICRDLVEPEVGGDVAIEIASNVEFTVEELRDKPDLAEVARSILANFINASARLLPPGLAEATASALWLQSLGELTWLGKRLKPDGGWPALRNRLTLSLIYYEKEFSGLHTLETAAGEVAKRYPGMEVNWSALEKARDRGRLSEFCNYSAKAGRDHKNQSHPYSPPFRSHYAMSKLFGVGGTQQHQQERRQ